MENCPLLKAKLHTFKKKKAMCTTWEEESESEEDSSNKESIEDNRNEVEEIDPTYDLLLAF